MSIPLPQFPDGSKLTHSSESTWKACNKKYLYKYVMGLRPAHDAEALRVGHMFHLGLEFFKERKPLSDALYAIDHAYYDTPAPDYLDPEEYEIEQATVKAMVSAYYKRYWDDAILEYAAKEVPFDLPIHNPFSEGFQVHPFYRNAGKIDAVVKLPDGRYALMEHKTTIDAIDDASEYWDKLMMDHQISRYFLAARDLGFDVVTTVYDVVRKPQIRPKTVTKTDRQSATYKKKYYGLDLTGMCPEKETPQMYAARLYYDMAVERPDWYFSRREIPRTEADIAAYRQEQWTLADQIGYAESLYPTWGPSAFPRNTNSCTSFGRCQYFNVCRGALGDPAREVPAGFKLSEVLHEELR